jgi:hypothetical protein
MAGQRVACALCQAISAECCPGKQFPGKRNDRVVMAHGLGALVMSLRKLQDAVPQTAS